MQPTDIDYTGWKHGKCWWIAVKFSGPKANAANAAKVYEMVWKGYEVREMPRQEACAAHLAAIS